MNYPIDTRIFIRVTSHRARGRVFAVIGERRGYYFTDRERHRGRSYGIYLVTGKELAKLRAANIDKAWNLVRRPYFDLEPCISWSNSL